MKAELLLTNAKIRTMDTSRPLAQSLAVLNGRIIAIGDNHELANLAGPDTIVLNLKEKTVLPAFIDAHEHLSWFSESSLTLNCSPQKTNSIEKLLSLVKRETDMAGPGEWIRGIQYDDTKMSENRVLNRRDLDIAAPNNPVIVIHVSGHWAVVNSAALKLGELNRHSVNPKGGVLGRDVSTGSLDGVLLEMAMFDFAFESLATQPTIVPPFPRMVRKKAVIEAAKKLNRSGISGVSDALCPPSYITTYHDLMIAKELPLRVNMIIPHIFLNHLENLGLIGGWGNEWVRSAGIKIIVDGAIAGHTSALKDGHEDDPDDHGILLIEDQLELDQIVQRIHDMNYQACIHANGDLAIEMSLNAIEQAQQKRPGLTPRHRIEHCTMITDNILKRMHQLKVMALPFASYLWQHGEKLKPFYGQRAHRMFAHNSFLNAGVRVAASSDHPVGLQSPLLGVQCMVTRKSSTGEIIGPQEKISIDEAFKMYTAYAAYATGEETIKGTLSLGKLADMVILNRDPWSIPPEEISQIGVVNTIVDGKIVYAHEE